MIEAYADTVVFAAIIGVFLVAYATTFLVQRSRRRADELATVAEAEKAHFAALEKIISDPAVSDAMKDFVTTFHKGVMTREVARRFCRRFFSGEMRRPAKSDHDEQFAIVDREMSILQRTRPDLIEAVHTLNATGLVIVFLRWPETAAHFQKAVLEMSVDARKERAFPKAVVDQEDFHDFGRTGGLAAVG